MSDKSDTTYFREIIRRLKEMEIEFRRSPKSDATVYSEMGEKVELMELPFPPELFDRLSSEEKEKLFIWLNRRNMPQA
tara:strand:+ start:56 stop:289 length:234 start_codon:yes stop_codon:yes gene_type:complete